MPMLNSPLRFVLICAVISPVFLTADTVVEEIIARVNNQIITRSDYQHEQQQLKEEAQQQDQAHADQIVTEGQKDVLRGLIDRQLLLEKGKDLGITADTELIKRLDEMRKQMKLESMDDQETAERARGRQLEHFEQNWSKEHNQQHEL